MYSNIKTEDNSLTFEMKNMNIKLGFVNALRRIILSEIPIYAIAQDSIKFYTNTSMIHNAMLNQRLILVPLIYNALEKYQDVEISLSMINNEDYMVDVTLKEFKVKADGRIIDPKDIFYSTDILFVKLKPEQEIDLKANIQKGYSKRDGAAFSPVAVSAISFKRDEAALKNALKDIPDDKKHNFILSDGDRYYLKNKENEPEVYLFNIESIGSLPPKRIFTMGFQVLRQKLNKLYSDISDEKIKIHKAEVAMESYDFDIEDEDDTLGNIVNSYLLTNLEIEYSGYFIPHPHDNLVIIRTALKNGNTQENNIKQFKKTLDNLLKLVEMAQKEWEKPSTKKLKIKSKTK